MEHFSQEYERCLRILEGDIKYNLTNDEDIQKYLGISYITDEIKFFVAWGFELQRQLFGIIDIMYRVLGLQSVHQIEMELNFPIVEYGDDATLNRKILYMLSFLIDTGFIHDYEFMGLNDFYIKLNRNDFLKKYSESFHPVYRKYSQILFNKLITFDPRIFTHEFDEYVLKFDLKNNSIILNDYLLVHQFRAGTLPLELIEHLYSENDYVECKQFLKNSDRKLTDVLKDMGFTGAIRKVFISMNGTSIKLYKRVNFLAIADKGSLIKFREELSKLRRIY